MDKVLAISRMRSQKRFSQNDQRVTKTTRAAKIPYPEITQMVKSKGSSHTNRRRNVANT